MTQSEWLTCTEPKPMLRFLLGTDAPRVQDVESFPDCKASDRKLRLFACACFHRIRHLLASRPVVEDGVEAAERFADGLATMDEFQQANARLMASLDALEESWRASRGDERTALLPIHEALALAFQITRPEAPKAAYYASSNACLAYAALNPGDSPAASRSYASQRAEEKNQTALLRDIVGNPFQAPPAIDPAVGAWNDGCIVKLASGIYEDRDFSQERMGVLADALMDAECDNEDILLHCRQSGGVHVRGCRIVDALLGKE